MISERRLKRMRSDALQAVHADLSNKSFSVDILLSEYLKSQENILHLTQELLDIHTLAKAPECLIVSTRNCS